MIIMTSSREWDWHSVASRFLRRSVHRTIFPDLDLMSITLLVSIVRPLAAAFKMDAAKLLILFVLLCLFNVRRQSISGAFQSAVLGIT
ncbi:hypothetical protein DIENCEPHELON_39 [Klebsiella phage vB_KaeS_Diencephalon]|nr:hypothetical protein DIENCEPHELON_39 [Klebsiella phage vB_KaeS_Diencephalon]